RDRRVDIAHVSGLTSSALRTHACQDVLISDSYSVIVLWWWSWKRQARSRRLRTRCPPEDPTAKAPTERVLRLLSAAHSLCTRRSARFSIFGTRTQQRLASDNFHPKGNYIMTLLSQPYVIDPNHVKLFREQGFVKLNQVLDDETLSRYKGEITDKVYELSTTSTPLSERTTYQRAFLQVWGLWKQSALIREFVFSLRLAKIAAELLEVEGVRLYHDQALYKEGGGGITPWHADQYYWPLSSDRTCTIWIPLQNTPEAMGPITFSAGSQYFSYGRNLPISDESEGALQEALMKCGFSVVQTPFNLGDVSIHLGWTFHRAPPNLTDRAREVMTIIYVDSEIKICEPANEEQAHSAGICMPDGVVGSVPGTTYNPVLYRDSGSSQGRRIPPVSATVRP
ncbi:MAG: phytanoyl-CoA dioxygenase family protein, partial [Candidatus Micrarchaeaceae archaeon]